MSRGRIIIKGVAISVIRNILEIEDVNFLKMSHPAVAQMGHVMVSSEWTVEESGACQRNSVPFLN
jgi:hypothetical protein